MLERPGLIPEVNRIAAMCWDLKRAVHEQMSNELKHCFKEECAKSRAQRCERQIVEQEMITSRYCC